MAEVAGSNPAEPIFLQSATLEPFIGLLSDTRNMAKKKHNKDKRCTTLKKSCTTLTSSI
jgi:hypothetical protein